MSSTWPFKAAPHVIDMLKARAMPDKLFAANDPSPDALEFEVEGKRYTLSQMLTANADDPQFCAWARAAKPGEFFAGIVGCQCLAAGDLSEADLIAIDKAYEAQKDADCRDFGRRLADIAARHERPSELELAQGWTA